MRVAGRGSRGFEAGDDRGKERSGKVRAFPQAHLGLVEGVGRREQDREQLGAERDLPVARRGQQGLHAMAGAFDQPHVDRPRRPLETVRRAEERPQALGAAGAGRLFLQRQQVAVEGGDVLFQLVEKGRHQLFEQRILVHVVISQIHERGMSTPVSRSKQGVDTPRSPTDPHSTPRASVSRVPRALRSWAACSACRVADRFWRAT